MDQISFGMVLRDARERKGYDLANAARRLRIRPDILQAIEASDFSRMPPRGYARNMVNAYARYLGLNPTEITRMYLDECYAFQVGKARLDARSTGFDMSGAPANKRGGRRDYYEEPEASSALGRKLYVDDPHRDRRRDDPNAYDRPHGEERTHRTNRSAMPSTQYTNFYSGPRTSTMTSSKLPFIIAGAVILVLLIIVLVLVFGQGGNASNEDVPKVPVTGLSDPKDTGATDTGKTETTPETQTPAKVAPTKAVFKYEILSGQSAYIEVYDGDTLVEGGADAINGPASKEYDVVTTLRFVTTNPDGVKAYVDGVEVSLVDTNGGGVYETTVDFPAILEKWKQDNPTTSNTTPVTGNTAG